jgi:hypothetical protein
MKLKILGVTAIFLLATGHVPASGPLGIYGIVEKVVFEPNETSPERVQLWGAFSYVEGVMPDGVMVVSRAGRGYLYFKLFAYSPGGPAPSEATAVRREWLDLKAVAGTGQAVGFGRWPGGVRSQDPPSVILAPELRGTEPVFRVRPASEKPESPAPYMTNYGVVKISDQGASGWIVTQLREALKR